MREDVDEVLKVGTAIITCAAIVMIFAIGGSTYNKHTLINKIENNADNVTVYIDGEEVPLESINLNYYTITYDEANNIVKLTKPVYNRIRPVTVLVIR